MRDESLALLGVRDRLPEHTSALPSAMGTHTDTGTGADQQAARDAEMGGAGDEFAANERAVLERPNESAHWLAYVAALVQCGSWQIRRMNRQCLMLYRIHVPHD